MTHKQMPLNTSQNRPFRFIARVIGWSFIVAVPLWLLLSGARLVMTDTYLYFEYSKPDFPADPYGFSQDERRDYAPFALRYLQNDQDISYLRELSFPDGSPMYNARELGHMVDVKAVVQTAILAHVVLSMGLLISIIFLCWKPETRPTLRRGIFSGAIMTLGLLVGLVVIVALNWDFFFEEFHRIFFEDGSWRFEYSDTLIRLFPERFWIDAAVTVGIIAAGGALILLVVVWIWRRRLLSVLEHETAAPSVTTPQDAAISDTDV